MKYWLTVSIAVAFLLSFSMPAAKAQGFTGSRNNIVSGSNRRLGSAWLAHVPMAGNSGDQSGWRNGLPPTRMDSFVKEAKHHAAHIYGDEGTYGLPPYMGFSKVHRINTGIMDERDSGLTTNHGSYLPDAWGGDEFHQNEWSQSGQRGHTSASGYPDGLPVMTGAGQSGPGGSQNLPPPPGPGYQPAYTCEGFVGYYSPEEVALAQTDFPAAFDHFVHSDRYTGSILNADLILRLQMGRPGF